MDDRQGGGNSVREEKKRREKEAIASAFYDLRKKAIEVEESMAKAKAIETEAKLIAEERDIMLRAKSLGGEGPCHHPRT
jgi:hypothetical protein